MYCRFSVLFAFISKRSFRADFLVTDQLTKCRLLLLQISFFFYLSVFSKIAFIRNVRIYTYTYISSKYDEHTRWKGRDHTILHICIIVRKNIQNIVVQEISEAFEFFEHSCIPQSYILIESSIPRL